MERHGDGFFTGDAEYVVDHTVSGWGVFRGDGSYAEFLDHDEAIEAAEALASDEKTDDEYEWVEVD